MADTTFIDYTQPAVNAAWLNDVNDNIYDTSTPPTGTFRHSLSVDNTSGTKGAGQVPFNPSLSYATSTLGKSLSQREWNPCDYPWLATFDGVTDDTAAIMACATALYAAGGGTILLPEGTVCANIDFVYSDNAKTLNWKGMGKKATYIKAFNTALPAFKVSSSSATLPTTALSEFSNFTVQGTAKLGVGFEFVLMARFTLRNLGATACSTAFNNRGSLIFNAYDCDFLLNTNGYVSRKEGTIRCNLVNWIGGSMEYNSGYGFDIGDAAGVQVIGTDLEHNGTLANVNTGDVVIRSTVDDEAGTSQINFIGTWHESNTGKGFTVEAAAGLFLNLKNVRLTTNGSGNDLNVGAINTLTLENCVSNTVITIAPTTSNIVGGSFVTINDTSVYSNRLNVASSGGLNVFRSATSAGSISLNPSTGVVDVGAAGLNSTGDVTVKGGNVMLKLNNLLANAAGVNAVALNNAPLATALQWIQVEGPGGKIYYIPCQRTA